MLNSIIITMAMVCAPVKTTCEIKERPTHKQGKERIHLLIEKFDTDKDQKLDSKELKKFLEKVKEFRKKKTHINKGKDSKKLKNRKVRKDSKELKIRKVKRERKG